MAPKVSIIIPIYNVEKYIKNCIDSIRLQTLKDIEIILIDDKSPDQSPKICDQYAQKDNRIIVVHKNKNEGLGMARNTGLNFATGEFVAFVDSDDFIDQRMYEFLYEKATTTNSDIAYCSLCFFINKNSIVPKKEIEKEIIISTEKEKKEFLLDFIAPKPSYKSDVKYMMSVCKALYKREMIEKQKIKFLSERDILSEDLFFNLEAIKQSNKILFSPSYFYYYRTNNESLSHSFSMEKYLKCRTFFLELDNFLKGFLDEQEYAHRLHRLEFLYLRIFYILSLKKFKGKEAIEYSNKILYDPLWTKCLKEYPFTSLPFKHRIIFWLLKNKHKNILYYISKIA